MFTNEEGIYIVQQIILKIQKNKEYLSELDGAIGDGDHGINMSKGFRLAQVEVDTINANMSEGFKIVSSVLMNKIGGSMGPLYGNFFRGFYTASKDQAIIDDEVIGKMLDKAYANIRAITTANVNDKTLIDVLDPAILAYHEQYQKSNDVNKSLDAMVIAGKKGLEATKQMVAKVGRAARLQSRSLNHQDAGATSCYLILETYAQSIKAIGKE